MEKSRKPVEKTGIQEFITFEKGTDFKVIFRLDITGMFDNKTTRVLFLEEDTYLEFPTANGAAYKMGQHLAVTHSAWDIAVYYKVTKVEEVKGGHFVRLDKVENAVN